MRAPLTESNSTYRPQQPTLSRTKSIKRTLRDGYIPANDETSYLTMDTQRKPSAFKLGSKIPRSGAITPVSRLPRRSTTPSSPTAKTSKGWVSSAAKRVGIGRTSEPRKSKEPESSPAIPNKVAKPPGVRTKSSIPSLKGRAHPSVNKPLPPGPSPFEKPLPSPPIAVVSSGTSPLRLGRTLIDASDPPLRKDSGTPNEREWPPLYPEKSDNLGPPTVASEEKASRTISSYTISSEYSQDAPLLESDSTMYDLDTSMTSITGDELMTSANGDAGRYSQPSTKTSQPVATASSETLSKPSISRFGFTASAYPSVLGKKTSSGQIRTTSDTVHDNHSPKRDWSALSKLKPLDIPRKAVDEPPSTFKLPQVLPWPPETNLSIGSAVEPRNSSPGTVQQPRDDQVSTGANAGAVASSHGAESSSEITQSSDNLGAAFISDAQAITITPVSPNPMEHESRNGNTQDVEAHQEAEQFLNVRKTRGNTISSVKVEAPTSPETLDTTSHKANDSDSRLVVRSPSPSERYLSHAKRLSFSSAFASFGPTLTISSEAEVILGTPGCAVTPNTDCHEPNAPNDSSLLPARVSSLGNDLRQDQKMDRNPDLMKVSEGSVPKGHTDLPNSSAKFEEASSLARLEEENELPDVRPTHVEVRTDQADIQQDDVRSEHGKSKTEVFPPLECHQIEEVPEPATGPFRHVRSTSPHVNLLLEHFGKQNEKPHVVCPLEMAHHVAGVDMNGTSNDAVDRTACQPDSRATSRGTSRASSRGSMIVHGRSSMLPIATRVPTAVSKNTSQRTLSGSTAADRCMKPPHNRIARAVPRNSSGSSSATASISRIDEHPLNRVKGSRAAASAKNIRNIEPGPRASSPEGLISGGVDNPQDIPRRKGEAKASHPHRATMASSLESSTEIKSPSKIRTKMSTFRQLFQKREPKPKNKSKEENKPAPENAVNASKKRRTQVTAAGSPLPKLTRPGSANPKRSSHPVSPRTSTPSTPSFLRTIPTALRAATSDSSPRDFLVPMMTSLLEQVRVMEDTVEKTRALTMAHAIGEAAESAREARLAMERAEVAAREAKFNHDRAEVAILQLRGMVEKCGGVKGFLARGAGIKQ